MKKITTYSNWCEFDQLEGKDLADLEPLIVKWPDGKLEQIECRVERSSYDDMGHPYNVPVRKAYVYSNHHGVTIKVPLVGLEAQRVNGQA